MSTDTLRAALSELVRHFPTDDDMLRARWTTKQTDDACTAYEAARAALSAHPARASQGPVATLGATRPSAGPDDGPLTRQEQGELSDEQLAAVWNAAIVGQPFVGAGELHVKGLRAIIAADRAARPESVDARRWRAFLDFSLGDKECALEDVDIQHIPSGHDGNHWSFIELAWKHPQWTKDTKDDANQAIDAAIAKGAES